MVSEPPPAAPSPEEDADRGYTTPPFEWWKEKGAGSRWRRDSRVAGQAADTAEGGGPAYSSPTGVLVALVVVVAPLLARLLFGRRAMIAVLVVEVALFLLPIGRRPRPLARRLRTTVPMIALIGFLVFREVTSPVNPSSPEAVIQDADVGSCVTAWPTDSSASGQSSPSEGVIKIVPCGQAHRAEVFARFEAQFGGSYPGLDQLSRAAETRCLSQGPARIDPRLAQTLTLGFYVPTQEGWQQGYRDITCAFVSPTDLIAKVGDAKLT